MKHNKIRSARYLSLLLVLLLNSLMAAAQPGGGGDPLPCDPDDVNGCAPLDTWVMVLVVAGLIFASYRLYRKQKALSL